MKLNADAKNFRVFGPDETASNRLEALYETTAKVFMEPTLPTDENLSTEGRVMEVLSEHMRPLRGEPDLGTPMGCSDILPQVVRRSSKKIVATRGGGELPPRGARAEVCASEGGYAAGRRASSGEIGAEGKSSLWRRARNKSLTLFLRGRGLPSWIRSEDRSPVEC